jgi:hypothetical protein
MPQYDIVEAWKQRARSRLRDDVGTHPRIRVRMELSFAFVTAIAGYRLLPAGPFFSFVGLTSVVLTHELTRALFARVVGRSSDVRISLQGCDTALAGAPSRGLQRLAFDWIGSVANLAAFVILVVLDARQQSPAPVVMFTRGLALSHAAWGIAQAVPLLPFRVGQRYARRLAPGHRFIHAVGRQ